MSTLGQPAVGVGVVCGTSPYPGVELVSGLAKGAHVLALRPVTYETRCRVGRRDHRALLNMCQTLRPAGNEVRR